MKVISLFDSNLSFSVNNELEEYRVQSLLDKEPETIAWIDSWDKSNSKVFYDVGSNIGIYSLYAAFRNPKLETFAFEPERKNYLALIQNINLNDFHIHPFHLAISNQTVLTNLFISDLRIGNSGAQINDPINDAGQYFEPKKVERILASSIDNLIDSFQMPIPNYVKIDVDGLESNIIDGMRGTLKSEKLESILIEFNNPDQYKKHIKEFENFGFRHNKAIELIPNHSNVRRSQKLSLARNVIFNRV